MKVRNETWRFTTEDHHRNILEGEARGAPDAFPYAKGADGINAVSSRPHFPFSIAHNPLKTQQIKCDQSEK